MEVRTETMTLGELIDAFESIPKDADVYFDFADLYPGEFDSYRGFYNQLALSWSEYPCTVETFMTRLHSADGNTYQGYKGGWFQMSRNTPVWVSNYGRASGTMIVDVVRLGKSVALIITRHKEAP